MLYCGRWMYCTLLQQPNSLWPCQKKLSLLATLAKFYRASESISRHLRVVLGYSGTLFAFSCTAGELLWDHRMNKLIMQHWHNNSFSCTSVSRLFPPARRGEEPGYKATINKYTTTILNVSVHSRHQSEHLLQYQSRESTSSWRSWGIPAHAMWYHWEQLSQATQPPSKSSSVPPHTGHTPRFLSDSSVELDSDPAKESSSTTGLLLETGAFFSGLLLLHLFFHFFSGFSVGCCINREKVICYQLEFRK